MLSPLLMSFQSMVIAVSISIAISGTKTGKSLLIEDGALPWIVQNANNEASPIRRHIELALCHLAQHGEHLPLPLPSSPKKKGKKETENVPS